MLNPYEEKKIDINLSSNEYFPKSMNTKPKNYQGKSYSDWTDKETDKETDIENYNIDNYHCNKGFGYGDGF